MYPKVLSQFVHKRALFEDKGKLIFAAQAFDWETRNGENSPSTQAVRCGGEGGIRTPGTVPRTLDFESSAFNRARPPLRVDSTS